MDTISTLQEQINQMIAAGWILGATASGDICFQKGGMNVWRVIKVNRKFQLVYVWKYDDEESRKFPAWTGKRNKQITIEEAIKLGNDLRNAG